MYKLLSKVLRVLSEAGMAISGLLLHISGVNQGTSFLVDCQRVDNEITDLIHELERERNLWS